MKFNFGFLALILLLVSCSKPTNDAVFVDTVTGRYLYNPDKTIEVYFIEGELFLKWNGANSIKPLKTGDTTYYVKEMNEKIQFLTNPKDGKMYFCLISKDGKAAVTYNFKKLNPEEKLASEYFESKEYDKAREGYLAIKKMDSLSPIIEEAKINRWGYNQIRDKHYDVAKEIFAINVALYPNSSNVYDSYGEALFFKGDTINAIANFKKSLAMDSGNRNAKHYLEKLEKE